MAKKKLGFLVERPLIKEKICFCALCFLSPFCFFWHARVVNKNGNRNWNNVNKRNGGARPDSLLKESFVDSENRSEKHILSKICQYCKVKEFSSFLIAKRDNLSAMEEYRNTHTSNE